MHPGHSMGNMQPNHANMGTTFTVNQPGMQPNSMVSILHSILNFKMANANMKMGKQGFVTGMQPMGMQSTFLHPFIINISESTNDGRNAWNDCNGTISSRNHV